MCDDFLVSNLKAVLQEKLWLLEDRLRQKRLLSSYKTLTAAEARILAVLRGEELTISAVARRLGVSRQAVHKIITNLVKRRLLGLHQIAGNSRDKLIYFTQEGKAMQKEAAIKLQELEDEVATSIGSNNLKLLKTLLRKKW
jgi:DNA-binding MarR family transcriptional regulator